MEEEICCLIGGESVRNEEIIETAIKMLKELDLDEVETIQIDNTKYDDGSVGFNVGVTFPAKKQ